MASSIPIEKVGSINSLTHQYECITFDPLETLFVEVGYENGKYRPIPNVDREGGHDLTIKVVSLLSGAVLLLASVLPFEKLVVAKGQRTGG